MLPWLTDTASWLLRVCELLLPVGALVLTRAALATGVDRRYRPALPVVLLVAAAALGSAVLGVAWLARHM